MKIQLLCKLMKLSNGIPYIILRGNDLFERYIKLIVSREWLSCPFLLRPTARFRLSTTAFSERRAMDSVSSIGPYESDSHLSTSTFNFSSKNSFLEHFNAFSNASPLLLRIASSTSLTNKLKLEINSVTRTQRSEREAKEKRVKFVGAVNAPVEREDRRLVSVDARATGDTCYTTLIQSGRPLPPLNFRTAARRASPSLLARTRSCKCRALNGPNGSDRMHARVQTAANRASTYKYAAARAHALRESKRSGASLETR